MGSSGCLHRRSLSNIYSVWTIYQPRILLTDDSTHSVHLLLILLNLNTLLLEIGAFLDIVILRALGCSKGLLAKHVYWKL